MAYENIKFRYPNMTIDGSYFYSFDAAYNSLICKLDDGSTSFNYPLDVMLNYSGVIQLTDVYITQCDGFYFWTLQRISSNGGIVIRKWDISNVATCVLIDEFIYSNDTYNTYVSSAMSVEDYHTVLTENLTTSGTTIKIAEYYDSVISAGTVITIVSTENGYHEDVTVSGVNIDEIILTEGVENNYIAGDKVHIVPSFFVFNEYYGTENTGSLMRFDATNGLLLSEDNDSEYQDVTASIFYRFQNILKDYPDAHSLVYVKGNQAKLRDMSDLVNIYTAESRNEYFTGSDYSYPNETDWGRTGTPYILDNRLFLNTVIDGTDAIHSEYRISGDFEAQVSGSLGGFSVINVDSHHFKHYMQFSTDNGDNLSIGVKYPSDGLWTPAEITTALWVDATDSGTITLDGSDKVEQWDDKSGNNRHMIQTNASLRPTVTSSGINDKDVVTFNNAITQRMYVSHNFGTSVSIFHVQRTVDNQYIMFGPGSTSAYGVCCHAGSTSVISSGFGSPTYFIDGTQTTIANRGVFYTLLHDRVSLVECVGASINWATFMLSGYTTTTWRFGGDIAELIIVSGIPSTEDRQKIEGYLAHKWGLTSNLPTSHTYKYDPPYLPYAGAAETELYIESNDDIKNLDALSGSEYMFKVKRVDDDFSLYYKTIVSGGFDPVWQYFGDVSLSNQPCQISLGLTSAGVTVSGAYFDDLIYNSGKVYYPVDSASFYGIMQMDNLRTTGVIIPVYDVAIQGGSLYRLQSEATYYGTNNSWTSYNYQVSPIRSFVNSISITAYPVILPANGMNTSDVTALIQDQYGEGSLNAPVFVTDDDNVGFITISPAYTDMNVKTGIAKTAYRSGVALRTVTIEGKVTQYD